MTTIRSIKSMGRSPLRVALLFIPLVFACFVLSPMAHAVSPAPDGGYPNGNTAEGNAALRDLTTGTFNTAVGLFSLTLNTGGDSNTGVGASALRNNTTGNQNTAVGADALRNNTTGVENSAFGFTALTSNTTGSANTATGHQALSDNTIGLDNTANGNGALASNTTGDDNTATGWLALASSTTGGDNTATGSDALAENTTGDDNTANGGDALAFNTIGSRNTATGFRALFSNTTGNDNIALGWHAGVDVSTGSNNIDIGNRGASSDSETIRIGQPGIHGATFVYGIRGTTTGNANALPVVIDSAGQLGTMSSSRRFKEEIKPMDKTSEAILGLKPVTFHYKSDTKDTPQFGLIAEEVAAVNPDLVVRDKEGDIYTVRYEAVNAMLLNEFLKARRQIDAQQKQIEALTAGLQKVSAQVEASKPTPQVVNNP